MEYRIGQASNFKDSELISFKNILIEAGEVLEKTFSGLISKNPILLFIPNTASAEAIGALKIPNTTYRNSVFQESVSELNPLDFKFELGWVVSLIQGKGYGNRITEILCKDKTMIYSTVRHENIIMQNILLKNGFKLCGIPYESKRGNYKNVLYVKV